jgi:hypothetical protein
MGLVQQAETVALGTSPVVAVAAELMDLQANRTLFRCAGGGGSKQRAGWRAGGNGGGIVFVGAATISLTGSLSSSGDVGEYPQVVEAVVVRQEVFIER